MSEPGKPNTPDGPESPVVMSAEDMAASILHLANAIAAHICDMDSVVLLGILKRGLPLAERLADHIERIKGVRPPVGALATTLYRDDLRAGVGHVKTDTGTTHFGFPLDDKTVILVDDVVAAGRTIRAAMDEVMDYGRPACIQLACLIDRGGRELPIQPDYLERKIAPPVDKYVSVLMVETDGQDAVLLEDKPEQL